MIEIEKNERIIKEVHRHWFILLGNIFSLFVGLAIPVIFLFSMHLLPLDRILAFTGNTFYAGGFFFFGWLLIIWMIGWKLWATYYFDVILITDKRIFNINQDALFSRESGSFRIDRIQNVTVDQRGIIQTLLDFGTITFETAGGDDHDFVAPFIAHPYEIKKLINAMQDGTLDKTQEVSLHSDSLDRITLIKNGENTASTTFRGGRLNDSEGI